jgi:hypothetical protein
VTRLPPRPLAVGFAIVLLPLVLSEPIGRALGLCNELFGCVGAVFFAGIPAGIVAGLVVTRWRDAGELVAGVWLGGVAYGLILTVLRGEPDLLAAAQTILVTVPFGAALFVGFLGLPLFTVVELVRWVARRPDRGRDSAELAPTDDASS